MVVEGSGSIKRTYHYTIDKEGVLYFDGTPVDDPWTVGFFLRNLEVDDEGRFVVVCDDELCYLEAEDTPYVVRSVTVKEGEDGVVRRVTLHFGGSYSERLDPSTLYVGGGNVLYCRVRGGRFAARFTRKAYYQLTPYVGYDEAEGFFFLSVGDRRHRIRL